MPHIKQHNIKVEVKSYLEIYLKDIPNSEKIDFKRLCSCIALGSSLYKQYTFKNGDIFVNKITQQQLQYIKGYLDSIIYHTDIFNKDE